MKGTSMLKGAVFGFGNVGQWITQSINIEKKYGESIKITSICDVDSNIREKAERVFHLKAYRNPGEMLENELDCVFITSTSDAHKQHVLLSAEKDLPIFCEKPIALNIRDARAITEAVEKRGLISLVRYVLRYWSCFLSLKKMVDDGELGDIVSLWARNCRGWGLHASGNVHPAVAHSERSGGWTIHHACHGADLMSWLGGEIEQVFCQHYTTFTNCKSEEVVWSNIKFTNGTIGMLGDTVAGVHERSVGVIGTRASASVMFDCVKPLIKIRREGSPDLAAPEIIDPESICQEIDPVRNFIEAIQTGAPTLVTVRDAMASLAVSLAMKKSAEQQRVVSVQEIYEND
ncbi:hypothetical protein GF337_18900 [candidate division KSB1 bacterium]|nr:hypothetical protein [candidate division KSB1 bacterium]